MWHPVYILSLLWGYFGPMLGTVLFLCLLFVIISLAARVLELTLLGMISIFRTVISQRA